MSTLTPVMVPEALDTTDVGTGNDLEAASSSSTASAIRTNRSFALFCKCIPG